jgi:hypothetical protein
MSTHDVQATGDATFAENTVHLEKSFDTSECLFLQGFTGKIALD